MDFNATIDLIIKDLREAGEIIDDLKKYPGVPVLQVELAKSKCRSAGEVIALLKSLENDIIQTTVTAHEKPEPAPVKTSAAVFAPAVTLIETPAETPSVPVIAPSPVITPTPVLKKEKEAKPKEKEAEVTTVADKFSQPASLYETQGGKIESEDEIPGLLNMKPLTSLTDAIGLNDKFLFIGQIFNGDKEAYNQAISRLDSAGNLDDAKAIIMSYTGNNAENDATRQLLGLVKRKFPSNE